MNCLQFSSFNAYNKHLKTLTDEELDLERERLSAFGNDFHYNFNLFKSKVFLNFVEKIAKFLKKGDYSNAKEFVYDLCHNCISFSKKIAKYLRKTTKLDLNTLILNEEISHETRKDNLAILKNLYLEICQDWIEGGYYHRLAYFCTNMNAHASLILEKFYSEKTEFYKNEQSLLDTFMNAPEVFFGKFNDKNEPDYKSILVALKDNCLLYHPSINFDPIQS